MVYQTVEGSALEMKVTLCDQNFHCMSLMMSLWVLLLKKAGKKRKEMTVKYCNNITNLQQGPQSNFWKEILDMLHVYLFTKPLWHVIIKFLTFLYTYFRDCADLGIANYLNFIKKHF